MFRTPVHTLEEVRPGGRYLALERVQDLSLIHISFGYRNGAPSPYQKDKRADSAKLSRIQLHLDDLVTQMGEQLYGGQIDAEPLVVSSSKSPCTWCDYSFICCHETGVHERALEAPA